MTKAWQGVCVAWSFHHFAASCGQRASSCGQAAVSILVRSAVIFSEQRPTNWLCMHEEHRGCVGSRTDTGCVTISVKSIKNYAVDSIIIFCKKDYNNFVVFNNF